MLILLKPRVRSFAEQDRLLKPVKELGLPLVTRSRVIRVEMTIIVAHTTAPSVNDRKGRILSRPPSFEVRPLQ